MFINSKKYEELSYLIIPFFQLHIYKQKYFLHFY